MNQNKFGQGPKYFGLVQIVLNMTVQFKKKSVARAKNRRTGLQNVPKKGQALEYGFIILQFGKD